MLGRTSKICFFAAMFVSLSISSNLVFAQEALDSQAKWISEVVLLNNGRVLQGQVRRTVDEVHVRTQTGSRIVLSAKRVDRIFDSLTDVWKHRGSKLDPNDIEGHSSLFHWCLKHELQAEAQQQLDRLMQTKIDVQRLKYLDRQLVRTFKAPKEDLTKKNRENETSEDSSNRSLSYLDVAEVFEPLPVIKSKRNPVPAAIIDEAVSQASYTQPAMVEPKDASQPRAVRMPLNKSIQSQLDSMTQSLARDDLHQFQRRVQPILVKGCLAAKCHTSTAAVMPLLHRGRGRLIPKRFTQRNLQSILDWVDAIDTDRSLLLTRSVTAHGGQKSPAMQSGSKEFVLLSAWVQQVAKNSPELIPTQGDSRTPDEIGLVGAESGDHRGYGANAVKRAKTSEKDVKSPNEHPEPFVDPFDPAAFNQLPK